MSANELTELATTVTPEKVRKCHRKRINYALAATLLANGSEYHEVAQEVGAKSVNVLKVGLHRLGLNKTVAMEPKQLANRVNLSLTARVANRASEILRDRFSRTLDRHTEALEQVEVKPDLDHIQRVGQALEPLARTAKIVHDWGNETKLGLVALGVVEQLDQAQDVIDITSSASDTTIAGVPESAPEPGTPQG